MVSESPRTPWLRWGAELRRHRNASGMTQQSLASAINVSSALISGFERGTRIPKRAHAADGDLALSTAGELERLWLEINDTREIPDEWRSFAVLERQASEIREYQTALIPGLLQSPAYARAVMRQGRDQQDTDEQIDHLTQARTSRLAHLHNTRLSFVLEETALRRVLGSKEAMVECLTHVLALLEDRRIRLSVIPDDAPLRPVVSAPFRIMNLPDGRLIGHAEHMFGENVVSDPHQVNFMVAIFGDMQAESLSPSVSKTVIEQIRRSLQ
ncbi:helix-turn-helix domain-containing protein [Nocardiopsis endophytica]|uniref:helix-turn-helix domain-containing protein n=1 Tax=Nocardiopsis endophytica TaxID=3018445 RepID=UPI002FDB68A1